MNDEIRDPHGLASQVARQAYPPQVPHHDVDCLELAGTAYVRLQDMIGRQRNEVRRLAVLSRNLDDRPSALVAEDLEPPSEPTAPGDSVAGRLMQVLQALDTLEKLQAHTSGELADCERKTFGEGAKSEGY